MADQEQHAPLLHGDDASSVSSSSINQQGKPSVLKRLKRRYHSAIEGIKSHGAFTHTSNRVVDGHRWVQQRASENHKILLIAGFILAIALIFGVVSGGLSICIMFTLLTSTVLAAIHKHDKSHDNYTDPIHWPPYDPPSKGELCLTPSCVKTAAKILEDIDQTVDPCDDFYQYSCGGWERNHDLPKDKGSVSTFASEENIKILKEILEGEYPGSSFLEGQDLPSPFGGVDRQNFDKLKSTFDSCMNQTEIDELGTKPIISLLADLLKTFKPSKGDDKRDLTNTIIYLESIGIAGLFRMNIDTDQKDTANYIISLYQPRNGLPSKEYYNDEKLIKKYKEAISATLTNIKLQDVGLHISTDESTVDAIVDMERQIALAGLDPEDLLNDVETYKPFTIEQIQANLTTFDLSQILSNFVKPSNIPKKLIVTSPEFFVSLDNITSSLPQSTIQMFLVWKVISDTVYHLSDDIAKPYIEFQNSLAGKEPWIRQDRWKDCVEEVDDLLGFSLGRFYVEKAFGENSKKVADDLVYSIKEALVSEFTELKWVDKETKKAAGEKTFNLDQKMGYPVESPDTMSPVSLSDWYTDLDVVKGEYFANYIKASKSENSRKWAQVGKPVDKGVWAMTPPTINAYYNPPGNEIVFPAGILQPPVFSVEQPQYMNYGAMGSVASHEISHSLDSLGRHYDQNGTLRDWWPNKTVDAFEERADCFVKQYSDFSITGPDGEKVNINGKLTEGENIADNGGLSIAFRAWKAQRSPETDFSLPGLDDLSPEQLFFVNFGRVWCNKMRSELVLRRVRTDPHSPAKIRVRGSVQNSKDFADAFKCPAGSPMNPSKKCKLW